VGTWYEVSDWKEFDPMRVEAGHTTSVVSLAVGQAAARPSRPHRVTSSHTDAVQLSEAAVHLRRLERAAQHAPDTRAERVAHLKALVQAGAYQVDTTALAERLLRAL
jgi:flagellar biosynthesis anti-sigma factor FlgM